MSSFAAIALDPAGIASWLVVGLIAGWLACKLMDAPSYGIGGDLFLGCLGAVVGGMLVGFFVTGNPEWWASLLVAVLGACLLIGVVRAVSAARSA